MSSNKAEDRAHLINEMKQDVDNNLTQESSMFKGGPDEDGNGSGNKQKKVLCIGAIITLIVAAVVLIVVLVPGSGSSDSGGGGEPIRPPGKKDDPDQKCFNNEYIKPGTKECTRCPDYETSFHDHDTCGAPTCGKGQITTINGECEDCSPYTAADKDGHKCAAPTCTWDATDTIYSHRINMQGECEPCPDFTRSNEKDGYITCATPTLGMGGCEANTHVINTGFCVTCEAFMGGDWESSEKTGQTCISRTCPYNQIILWDGTCNECPEGMEANPLEKNRECWKHLHGCNYWQSFRTLAAGEKAYDCTDKCFDDAGSTIYGYDPRDDESCMKWPEDIETLNGMEDVKYAANAMKYMLTKVPINWDDYDIRDPGTQDVRDYDRLESLGGGFIGGSKGLTYDGKAGILTPIFEEIDFETNEMAKINSKDIFHVKSIQHQDGGKLYTDLWILDHNSEDADTATLSGYAKGGKTVCCLADTDGEVRNVINGISRAVTTIFQGTPGSTDPADQKKAFVQSIYEGMLVKANPTGFGRFIYSAQGQSASFTGYFKADEKDVWKTIYTDKVDKGYGWLFMNQRPQWSGYYKGGSSFLDIPDKIKTFGYFDQIDKF